MNSQTIINTGIDTAVTTGALVHLPSTPVENPKALLIALATSVIVQLTLHGFNWLQKKLVKLSKKNDTQDKLENNP